MFIEDDDVKLWTELYIDKENNVRESYNSFNVFSEFYVDAEVVPTAKELSALSGFKKNTIQTWITKNKYKERRQAKKDYERLKNKELKDNLTNIMLVVTAKQIRNNSENDDKFIDKENSEIAKINELSVGSKEFNDLMKLHKFNKNSILKTHDSLKSFNELNEFDEIKNTDNNLINELLEKIEDSRINKSLESINQLKKEYENEPY